MATQKRESKRQLFARAKSLFVSNAAEIIQFGLLAVAVMGVTATYLQLKQNDSHLRLSQRPWVGLSEFPTYQTPTINGKVIPKLRYTWKNFGPTPALNVVAVPYKVPSGESPDPIVSSCERVRQMANGTDPETGPLTGKQGETLFPGQDTGILDPNDDAPFPDDWATNPKIFSVIGCAVYLDQFGSEHLTRTCHIVWPMPGENPMIRPCAGGATAQ